MENSKIQFKGSWRVYLTFADYLMGTLLIAFISWHMIDYLKPGYIFLMVLTFLVSQLSTWYWLLRIFENKNEEAIWALWDDYYQNKNMSFWCKIKYCFLPFTMKANRLTNWFWKNVDEKPFVTSFLLNILYGFIALIRWIMLLCFMQICYFLKLLALWSWNKDMTYNPRNKMEDQVI